MEVLRFLLTWRGICNYFLIMYDFKKSFLEDTLYQSKIVHFCYEFAVNFLFIRTAEFLHRKRLMMKMRPFLGTIFLFLVGLGVLGNSLLVLPILIFFTGQRPSPIHVIIAQITLGNLMFLLFRGIPLLIQNWGKKYFLYDVGCKIVFYLQRVGRGMSICSTCLLSGCQAIIVSSLAAKWAHLKQNALKYSIICSFVCWVINTFIYVFILTDINGPKKQFNITSGIELGYCYWASVLDYPSIIYTVQDVIFMVLVILSCGHMVYFLCRHHQQVRHIHSTSLCPSTNPEIRAIKRILLLVITFVSFYSVNCCLRLYITYIAPFSVWILDTSAIMAVVFPTISPFLLMANGRQILKCAVFGDKKLFFCSDCGCF